MSEPPKVKCQTHGWQAEAFVCQHIAQSLLTGVSVGFHWSREDASPHPDAWCSACEAARIEAGGDWTEAVEEVLNIKLLCGACYEHAKGHLDSWSQDHSMNELPFPARAVPNISVNADARERAFVQRHHNQQHSASKLHLAARGRRLP